MIKERKPNQPKEAAKEQPPLLFEELPFHIKCLVVLREHYTGLSLPNRIVLWLVVAGVILAPLGFVARPVVREWRQANMLLAARQYAETGDVQSAAKAYSRALHRSRNAANWREFAAFGDRHGLGNTSELWRQVTDLEPGASDGWIGMIEAALKAGDVAGALRAAERIPPGLANDVGIQIARGSALVIAGRSAEARAALDLALAGAPQDPKSRLSLALLALDTGDAAQKTAALKSLEVLAGHESDEFRPAALLALLRNCKAENLRIHGIAVARRISEDPAASPSSRLTALDALIKWNAPDLAASVSAAGRFAIESESQRLALMQFLLDRNQGAAAKAWVHGLRAEAVPEPQLLRLEAGMNLSDGDWDAFVTNIEGSGAFRANAGLARRLVEIATANTGNPNPASDEWTATLRELSEPGPELEIAMAIARQHDWEVGVIATMEYALLLHPNNSGLLRQLAIHYRRSRNLHALQRVQERLASAEPTNLSARNAALLGRLILGVGNPAAHLSESERLLEAEPRNPSFLTTRAVALYRTGRHREAADVFAEMRPEDARNPERALYRGLILSELGENDAALRELARAERDSAEMFPELLTLLNRARSRAELDKNDDPSPGANAGMKADSAQR